MRANDIFHRHSDKLNALLIAAVIAALWALAMLSPLEHWLEDRRARLLDRAATGDVVIVEIDSRSISELQQWPWPRSLHADLVDRLTAAGASTIAYDVDFSSPSHQGDADFAAAIERSGKVVLPIFYSRARRGDGQESAIINRPMESFSAAWVGAVNIYPDAGGTVRDYPAATHIDGQVTPSLATVVAQNSDWGDRTFRPDWSIDPRSIPRHAFVDVVEGRVPGHAFENKRIIVGSTAIELGDRYAVPVHGIMSGVVVQALAAESLVQGRALASTGWPVTIAGILLIAFLWRPRTGVKPVRYAAMAGFGLLALLAAPVAVQAMVPLSIESAPWLAALVLCAAVQLVLTVRRHIHDRARTDADTALPNRLAIEEALEGNARDAILVVASIRRFSDIREGMGTAASNEVVLEIAGRLSAQLGTPIYRIAPELIGWIDHDADGHSVEGRISSMNEVFRQAVSTSQGPVDVQLSYGVDAGIAAHGVLRIERALAAAETARREGHLVAVEGGAQPELRRELGLMGELRAAMDNGQVWLAYQPKYSLHENRIVSAEALIRWTDTDGRNVPPDSFIPLAESTGMITEVTLFALRSIVSQLAAWQRNGTPLHVSMNISPVDLAKPDFVDDVAAIIEAAKIDPAVLTLEITESAFIRSPEQALASLDRLRALGLRLSIDDYGTGLSTLSYLQKMPVQELKIDRSFITELLTRESDRVLVRSTIDMAHELELTVVAEGVEDAATLEELRGIGCDQIQGYLIGKPLTADEIIDLCRNSERQFVA
ncbi:putative bifunctional diguanylate cyclase/phosphodiesterase [Sphingomicrobium marinum]|uniref:putative bifunctional diguanylate cyclase/phosphodiesterase n=1 Tax=Sphingomicrobium marinum TaxID=1227950 RepID=UPI00223EDB0C|nr:EAL domain-containing protein [Sphingomicrobium marinum]